MCFANKLSSLPLTLLTVSKSLLFKKICWPQQMLYAHTSLLSNGEAFSVRLVGWGSLYMCWWIAENVLDTRLGFVFVTIGSEPASNAGEHWSGGEAWRLFLHFGAVSNWDKCSRSDIYMWFWVRWLGRHRLSKGESIGKETARELRAILYFLPTLTF